MDHPRKTKATSLKVHKSKQEVSAQRQEPQSHVMKSMSTDTVQKSELNIVIISKEQILSSYPDILKCIGRFPGPLYHIQVNPNITTKQNPCQLEPIHLKETFKKEKDKMLQVGIIKPVKEATPWINSFMLVEDKDKLGNPKPLICLDQRNLNTAIVCSLSLI